MDSNAVALCIQIPSACSPCHTDWLPPALFAQPPKLYVRELSETTIQHAVKPEFHDRYCKGRPDVIDSVSM